MVVERELAMGSPPLFPSHFWLCPNLMYVCGHPNPYILVLSTASTLKEAGPRGMHAGGMVRFGRVDLQKTSSGYSERGLEGKVQAPGGDIHLWLQIPQPPGMGLGLRTAR